MIPYEITNLLRKYEIKTNLIVIFRIFVLFRNFVADLLPLIVSQLHPVQQPVFAVDEKEIVLGGRKQNLRYVVAGGNESAGRGRENFQDLASVGVYFNQFVVDLEISFIIIIRQNETRRNIVRNGAVNRFVVYAPGAFFGDGRQSEIIGFLGDNVFKI